MTTVLDLSNKDLREFIDSTPDLTARDNGSGKDWLHTAVEQRSLEHAAYLIVIGLPVKRRYEGYTLIHIAVLKGDTAMVSLLIAAGADVNAVTDEGQTPLHKAMSLSNRQEMIKVLMDRGADPSIVDDKGRKPIDYLIELEPSLGLLIQHELSKAA